MPAPSLTSPEQAIRQSWSKLYQLTNSDMAAVGVLSCLIGKDQDFDLEAQRLKNLLELLELEMGPGTLQRLITFHFLASQGDRKVVSVQYQPEDWARVRRTFRDVAPVKYRQVNEHLFRRLTNSHDRSATERYALYLYRAYRDAGRPEVWQQLNQGTMEERQNFFLLLEHEML